MSASDTDAKRLQVARNMIEHLASVLDSALSVRLWDGSMIPLGSNTEPGYFISISGPGVLGALLRSPKPDTLMRLFSSGQIDFHGGDMMQFAAVAQRSRKARRKMRALSKFYMLRQLLPFLFCPAEKDIPSHRFRGDEHGHKRTLDDQRDFIQFHYDISNEFYQLFLDPEMQYSCGYFNDWQGSLEQAQLDKLDMICRKLRLKSGETLLDIGCGWGGLICHAAEHYGVTAHGVTLAQRQYDFAQEKIERLGLSDRVSVELKDFNHLRGTWDKISSIGMIEHVGIANMPSYFKKIYSLLPDRGIYLNHGITRRGKRDRSKMSRDPMSKKLLKKYIFPGGELDDIGHTVEQLEGARFEVHDVEAWREHYARTCRLWSERLYKRQDEAIAHVGYERYRIWLVYLTSVSYGFTNGTIRIFQTVATKHRARGNSGMPPTRKHLYE